MLKHAAVKSLSKFGLNQHSVKLKLAKGWITQSKYPQVVRKIGLFWQFEQISRPVLARAGTYTKSGPGPRAVSLLCPVGSYLSFIIVYRQCRSECVKSGALQEQSRVSPSPGSHRVAGFDAAASANLKPAPVLANPSNFQTKCLSVDH